MDFIDLKKKANNNHLITDDEEQYKDAQKPFVATLNAINITSTNMYVSSIFVNPQHQAHAIFQKKIIC